MHRQGRQSPAAAHQLPWGFREPAGYPRERAPSCTLCGPTHASLLLAFHWGLLLLTAANYPSSTAAAVKIWDLRAPGCQREYESRAAVNTVVLHPNQGELISGAVCCSLGARLPAAATPHTCCRWAVPFYVCLPCFRSAPQLASGRRGLLRCSAVVGHIPPLRSSLHFTLACTNVAFCRCGCCTLHAKY